MHGGMASASASASPAAAAPACPYATLSGARRSATTGRCHGRRRRRAMSCRAATGGGGLWLPRRDVLTGLTGVATGLTAFPGLGLAGDEQSKAATDLYGGRRLQCDVKDLPCPPAYSEGEIVDMAQLLRTDGAPPQRKRRPAHELSPGEIGKYKDALTAMKGLPDDHPLSFKRMAAVHEAYCDSHYHLARPADKDRPFDVHFSWIFAPWHRMYIYFYERALGHLAGDDTFALPYWSWDTPAGMTIPPMFRDEGSPLYDRNRDLAHLNAVVDLDYLRRKSLKKETVMETTPPENAAYKDLIDNNLCTLHNQMKLRGQSATGFLGQKFRSDEKEVKKGQGSLEDMAHTAVHVWVGRPEDLKDPKDKERCKADPAAAVGHDGQKHCANDMGFLGSASRDPLFYSHHANVDRMWHTWSTELGGGDGFKDEDWRNYSFVFYEFSGKDRHDMKSRPVRVRVADVLDPAKLGYEYQEPTTTTKGYRDWRDSKPTSTLQAPDAPAVGKRRTTRSIPPTEESALPVSFPLALKPSEAVVVPEVARPPPQRKQNDKKAVEVLVIEGVDFDPGRTTKFDVAINAPRGSALQVGPQYKEFAGSFGSVQAAKERPGDRQVVMLAIPIDKVLAEVGGAAGDAVSVVIVPRAGDVTIRSAPRIEIQDQE